MPVWATAYEQGHLDADRYLKASQPPESGSDSFLLIQARSEGYTSPWSYIFDYMTLQQKLLEEVCDFCLPILRSIHNCICKICHRLSKIHSIDHTLVTNICTSMCLSCLYMPDSKVKPLRSIIWQVEDSCFASLTIISSSILRFLVAIDFADPAAEAEYVAKRQKYLRVCFFRVWGHSEHSY